MRKLNHASVMAVVVLTVLSCFGLPDRKVAQAQQGSQPTTPSSQSADNALSTTPWYDAESRQLVPVPVASELPENQNRTSRWLPKAQRVQKPAASTTTGTSSGLFGSGWTLGNIFAWTLLIAIVIATVASVVYAFSRAEFGLASGNASRRRFSDAPDDQMIERMKQLPAELRMVTGNLREETLRMMASGDYSKAIIVLFGHQLLMLDKAGLLRLTRGKTNGRYVRETRSSNSAAATHFVTTVDAFERCYFGRHQLSRLEMDQLWENNLKLEAIVEPRGEVAA